MIDNLMKCNTINGCAASKWTWIGFWTVLKKFGYRNALKPQIQYQDKMSLECQL